MAESQSSNSSCSDRDSLRSSERNIMNRDHRAPDTELASVDDDDDDVLPVNTNEHDAGRPLHEEQRNNSELKQPKTIKNIMIALREGKSRENSSPMRSNNAKASGARIIVEASPRVTKPGPISYGLKGNAEIPAATPAKAHSDSNKRIQGSHSLKHQVF